MTKNYPYQFSQDYPSLFAQIMEGKTLIAIIEEVINGSTIQRICEVRLMPHDITNNRNEIDFSVVGYCFATAENLEIHGILTTIEQHFLQICKTFNAKFLAPNI